MSLNRIFLDDALLSLRKTVQLDYPSRLSFVPLQPSQNLLPWISKSREVEAEAVDRLVCLAAALYEDTRGDMDCMCNCW